MVVRISYWIGLVIASYLILLRSFHRQLTLDSEPLKQKENVLPYLCQMGSSIWDNLIHFHYFPQRLQIIICKLISVSKIHLFFVANYPGWNKPVQLQRLTIKYKYFAWIKLSYFGQIFFISWFTNPPTVIFRKVKKIYYLFHFIRRLCIIFVSLKKNIFEVLSVYFWEWYLKVIVLCKF